MDMVVQQIINGLTMGCIFGLIGLGYTMVYGVLGMVNFAHGEIFMLGPMFALFLLRSAGVVAGPFSRPVAGLSGSGLVMAIGLGLGGAMLFSGVVGVLVERLAYRRVRRAGSRSIILSALGASIFLQNTVMLVAGRDKKAFPRLLTTRYFTVGGAVFSNIQILLSIATVAFLLVILYVVERTDLGRCIRATSENRNAASLMGVNTNQIIAIVFLIGAAAGGGSGWLYSMQYEHAVYSMGAIIAIKGFTAAVVGGIGNVAGSVLGGLALGVLEALFGGLLPIVTKGRLGTEYKDILTFAVLAAVLLVRPQGLLGRASKSRL